MVNGFQSYKTAKLAIKKNVRHFGFEATFYIVVHGRILAKIIKVKVDELCGLVTLKPFDQNELMIPL